jgi:hypothetical protein
VAGLAADLISESEMKDRGLTVEDCQARGIHLTSKNCWCDPDTEIVEGK